MDRALAELDLALTVPYVASPAARVRFGSFERTVTMARPVQVIRSNRIAGTTWRWRPRCGRATAAPALTKPMVGMMTRMKNSPRLLALLALALLAAADARPAQSPHAGAVVNALAFEGGFRLWAPVSFSEPKGTARPAAAAAPAAPPAVG